MSLVARSRQRKRQGAELSRRSFLVQAVAGLATLHAIPACRSGRTLLPLGPDGAPRPLTPTPDWLANARVANLSAWANIDRAALRDKLAQLADEGVNVAEVDLALYQYDADPDDFQAKVDTLDEISRAAHEWGMRTVAYYSTGEVITEDADKRPNRMSTDHPDWLQVAIDGEPVTFTGGGRVFWVAAGEESAWMCPTSGFADYYIKRARMVAATAADGMWVDVPLFSDAVTPMACTNPSCASLFKKETGFDIPRTENLASKSNDELRAILDRLWDTPAFRRFVRWRHEILQRWQLRIASECAAVRSDFKVVIETVSVDNNRGTLYGLDASFTNDDSLYRVWEVSPVADNTAMHDGYADDWMSLASMMKFCAGATAPKPAWAFTYGYQSDDAEYALGIAVNAGVCPFEAKIPDMTKSVGSAYRQRVFKWIEANGEIYAARPRHDVALVHSSASRDFLDRGKGQGIHASEGANSQGDTLFNEHDSILNLDYMGDYRGSGRALMHSHVPFGVITEPMLELAKLKEFKLVVLPSAMALSDGAIGALATYVDEGGSLLVTGPDAGSVDVLGVGRPGPRLLEVLGLKPNGDGWQTVQRNRGTLHYHPQRAGLQYVRTDDDLLRAGFENAAGSVGAALETDAALRVLMDLRDAPDGSKTYLLCTSLEGLGEKVSNGKGIFAPRRSAFSVTLACRGKKPTRVSMTSISGDAKPRDLPFDAHDDKVTFQLADVGALLIATVTY